MWASALLLKRGVFSSKLVGRCLIGWGVIKSWRLKYRRSIGNWDLVGQLGKGVVGGVCMGGLFWLWDVIAALAYVAAFC